MSRVLWFCYAFPHFWSIQSSRWSAPFRPLKVFPTIVRSTPLVSPNFKPSTRVLFSSKNVPLRVDRFSFYTNTCIFRSNLWLTGIFFKVIPCILLMLFTAALLYELDLNRRRRQLITSGSTPASRKTTAQSDRTTKVLIILLFIFLCTEFPQGIFWDCIKGFLKRQIVIDMLL